MNLVGRKFYIDTETDKWLEDNFGAQRERSRAVDLALSDFMRKIESNRVKVEVPRIDLARLTK
jgi:hypothetical protein